MVVGGEDVSAHKPDPEGLLLAAARLGRDPSEILYVGDSVTDAETARRAAVCFAAVLSGVTPAAAFAEYGPCAVLDSLPQLPPLVVV